ncbi:carboxy terminal-processing peptidase [Psychroserpens jangbogonensis]|uniref:carboxy terminal-processing peptidase n=1 Tax=Psychroserpens jangbogonensis TaxID=1484460 RepID=UPI00053F2A05|nr:carboxy terminal-processing peptidase [Psychroserpens jangbogonensis]
MQRNYKLLLLVLLLAFASCSFTSKKFEDPDKDKLVFQLVTYLLDEMHFNPKDINDDFSKEIFDDYLKQLDPLKRYFYASDIKEFEKYKTDLDDQIKAYEVTFFDLTFDRYEQRLAESKEIYKEVLENPFDFTMEEEFSTKYEELTYVNSKKELKERWRHQLKFSTIANYDDLIAQQERDIKRVSESDSEDDKDVDFTKKSLVELEKESRGITLKSLNELYEYMEDRRRKDLLSVYVNAIVREYDPHTAYYEPEDKERFDASISGKFEGIGARLQKKMDVITIMEVIAGGPAWRQKELEAGDQILKVKQEDEEEPLNVVGMRTSDAVKFIKGPKGTDVTLTVRKVDGSIQDITITRDIVEMGEVYAKSSTVIKDGKKYGIIDLPGFYVDFNDVNNRNAASDVKIEIERLKAEGMEGLVIDLRNNGGGSLQTVVDMAGFFIKEGPVVQVKTSGEPKEVLMDRDRSIVWDGPLVILVNESSASASEILAAAMQDYKRAIIIGSDQTYGKGTVQTVVDLNRMVRNNTSGDIGALKLTIQKFYRINGGSNQLEGVKSDVVIPNRYSYIDIGEKNQENPLPWSQIEPAQYDVWDSYFDYDTTIAKSKERMASNEQLNLIDENAQWVKKIRDKELFSLNYNDYRTSLDISEKEAKRFEELSNYQTNLTFESLSQEIKLMEQDSVLRDKRERWHTSLSKDVYIEEALNVLNDLKMTYGIKSKVATSVKN